MMLKQLLLFLCLLVISTAEDPLSRHVDVLNESGNKLEVFWVNAFTGELVPFSEVYSGSSFRINSYVNHTFMIRENSSNSTSCDAEEEGCRVNYLVVSDDPDQVIHVTEDLEIEYEEHTTEKKEATDILKRCKDQALASMARANGQLDVDALTACMTGDITNAIERKNEEVALETQMRKHVANQLENYTCADNDLPTTEPIEVREWTHQRDGSTRTVNVLHEREASRIHVIKNFITEDECDAIEKAAQKRLHRATVADGAGGSQLSDHRKAMQAGVEIPWDKEEDGDLIARVTRRLYDYTNDVTGFGIDVVGQEELMSIQYFGRGVEDTAPDQYRPHCDGDCDGLPHKTGGRVATMVMYCTVPEVGGATNFQQAGAHVKPELGAAAFFSYMNADTMIKDTGYTTHSGCPVVEGTKRIAVQWMRVGVDKENPWDSFNTLTIKKSDAED